MTVKSLPEIARDLVHAMKLASRRDPDLGVYSKLAERSGVKTTTLQSWFLGNHEPRARALAQVAAVLSVSMDRLVYSGAPKAFRQLGIDDLVADLKDTERAELADAIRLIVETARLGDRPELVITAFRKQIATCAEMCQKLH